MEGNGTVLEEGTAAGGGLEEDTSGRCPSRATFSWISFALMVGTRGGAVDKVRRAVEVPGGRLERASSCRKASQALLSKVAKRGGQR